MGILKILNKLFLKNKKIIVLGLDNSGKSTLISFLKTGTYNEHITPTMGKEESLMDVQGIKMKLIDVGGQSDFRSLWMGELNDTECILFILDANAKHRFKEAKKELWKLSKEINNKPLFILANKYDLSPVASIKEIIQELDLMKFSNFEIMPISSKTGYGIVNAFSKLYLRLTGVPLERKLKPIALTVFNNAGIPLTTKEGKCNDDDVLKGGLFTAITEFVKKSYNSELNQLRLEGKLIIFRKTKHFMASLVTDANQSFDINDAELGLKELLDHLENMCSSTEFNNKDIHRIDYLVKQYATNIFC
ncbi:MAG: GTP-binding protein [Promethearchaeota archaeon]|nr:MAG: GTP-binding protein [Candidatus Lokiarchaeota archaeon]